MQKQQLRRQQWDNDYDDLEGDPESALPEDDELIETPDDHEDEDADEDEDRG